MSQKADQVRKLLSSYYGTLTVQDDSLHSEPSAPARLKSTLLANVRAYGIDSTAFDADRYVANVLDEATLCKLLNNYVQVSTEVKTLDSDMQMLIYENYNQFIAALDVIKTMRENTGVMEDKMNELQSMIEEFAVGNEVLGNRFRRKRAELEELQTVQRLLYGLQAAFALPHTMEAALSESRWEDAVRQYSSCAPFLKMYAHKGAFRRVCASVERCRQQLADELCTQLLDGVKAVQQAVQLVNMLDQIGEPLDVLQDDVLNSFCGRVMRLVHEAQAMLQAMKAAQEGAAVEGIVPEGGLWDFGVSVVPLLLDFITEFDRRFIEDVSFTSHLFCAVFDTAAGEAMRKVVIGAVSEFLGTAESAFTIAANGVARQAGEYITTAMEGAATGREVVRFPLEWGTSLICEALQQFECDVHQLEALALGLNIQQKRFKIMQAVVVRHMRACFNALADAVMHIITAAHKTMSAGSTMDEVSPLAVQTQLLHSHSSISAILTQGVEAVMKALKQYEGYTWILEDWEDKFVDSIQGEMQRLLTCLMDQFLSRCSLPGLPQDNSDAFTEVAGVSDRLGSFFSTLSQGGEEGDEGDITDESPQKLDVDACPGMLLLLCHVCWSMESVVVPFMLEAFAMRFAGMGGGSRREQDSPPAFVASEVARKLGQCGQLLLEGYVAVRGRGLSQALVAQMAQESLSLEDTLAAHLEAAEQEVVQLVDDGGHRGATSPFASSQEGQRSRLDAGWSGELSALERNVARLFNERVTIFTKVESTQASILAGISKVALKSTVEFVRLRTFTVKEQRQLSAAVQTVPHTARRFFQGSEGRLVNHLIEELLHAVMERTVDGEPAPNLST